MPNRYDPDIVDQPVSEPISLAEAKLHSHVTGSNEDTTFGIYIGAAREYLEGRMGRTFYQKTLAWQLDYWPGLGVLPVGGLQVPTFPNSFGGLYLPRHIELPLATPLLDILSVIYTDSDGNPRTWDSGEYEADRFSYPGRLVLGFNKTWPSFTPKPSGAIRILYTAGLRSSPPEDVPYSIKYPLLLLVGGMYLNREGEQIPDRNVLDTIALKYGIEAYIQKLRVPSQWAET